MVIGKYSADKGSVVINGLSFSNGIGDGTFGVIFESDKPEDVGEIGFVDFRDRVDLVWWEYDCDPLSECRVSREVLGGAECVGFGINGNGDLIFWKIF